ncbi:MAG: HAD-IA family hydrolase [Patescibacteria group bacterium]
MVTFVYFDLGGVVIQDFSGTNKWEEIKKEWKITDKYWDKFEPKLCAGQEKISSELLNAFVSRFETNPSIWPVIDEIHGRCKIGLLTNMYPGMFAAIREKGILPKIFELAEQKSGVKGKDILFVDNSLKNIEAASNFGWQTFLYDSSNLKESSHKLSDLVSIMN